MLNKFNTMLTMFKTTLRLAQQIFNVQKDVQNCQEHVCKHKNIKDRNDYDLF